MNTTLQNNRTKCGAKIFKPYRVITFLVLGHFFSRTLYSVRLAVLSVQVLLCQDYFEFDLPSVVVEKQRKNFSIVLNFELNHMLHYR